MLRTLPRRTLTRKCCQRAFLRGAFLGVGFVTPPEKGYHLEFVCSTDQRAEAISRILTVCGYDSGIMIRRGRYVVYLKRSGQISALLGLLGASRAMLHYENLLTQRSLRENVKRITNCDTGNMKRQVSAAAAQVQAIETLLSHNAMDLLSPALREVAWLRLHHPDLSLEQLGQLLETPLGKSGVNHRLSRIMEIAAEYSG